MLARLMGHKKSMFCRKVIPCPPRRTGHRGRSSAAGMWSIGRRPRRVLFGYDVPLGCSRISGASARSPRISRCGRESERYKCDIRLCTHVHVHCLHSSSKEDCCLGSPMLAKCGGCAGHEAAFNKREFYKTVGGNVLQLLPCLEKKA